MPCVQCGSCRDYVVQLHGGGKTFNVYVHSYLGYGLMAGRAKLIDAGEKGKPHSCIHEGAAGTYAYAGKEYTFSGGETDFDACAEIGGSALQANLTCGTKPVRPGGWLGVGS